MSIESICPDVLPCDQRHGDPGLHLLKESSSHAPSHFLGAVHTIVSLATVAVGLYSLPDARRSTAPLDLPIYPAAMVVSVFTSFGLSSTGGFNAGHALGILTLLAILGGLLVPRIKVWSVRGLTYPSSHSRSVSFCC